MDLKRNDDCKPTVLKYSSRVTQMGRAWLWTWRLGILSDFPEVALGIGSLSDRGKVGNDLL